MIMQDAYPKEYKIGRWYKSRYPFGLYDKPFDPVASPRWYPKGRLVKPISVWHRQSGTYYQVALKNGDCGWIEACRAAFVQRGDG